MKKLMIAAIGLLVASCSQIELPEAEMEAQTGESRKFTFTVKGDFLSPEFREGGPRKANAYMTADGVEMTDLWVVDVVGGEVRQVLHQSSTDADWGAPSMALTLGTHHVMFLASRGQGAQYQDGVVSWQKPLDAFYLDYDVTVTKTSNGNRAVTLQRCATKATIYVEDAIPAGTTTISVMPTRWFTGWNMLRGVPVAAQEGYAVVFDVTQAWWGRTGGSLNVWSLSGTEEWIADVAVVSMAGQAVNGSALIEGAPMVANRTTIYRGCLYSQQSDAAVQLDQEWSVAYEGVY